MSYIIYHTSHAYACIIYTYYIRTYSPTKITHIYMEYVFTYNRGGRDSRCSSWNAELAGVV